MAGGKRSQHRDLAAVALATGATIASAASAAGVDERTLYRWQAEPEFRARVAELRADAVSRALGRLSDNMYSAAGVLVALLADTDPDVRHRAAVKILEVGMRLRDQVDLAERLAAVEQALRAPDVAPTVVPPRVHREGDDPADSGP